MRSALTVPEINRLYKHVCSSTKYSGLQQRRQVISDIVALYCPIGCNILRSLSETSAQLHRLGSGSFEFESATQKLQPELFCTVGNDIVQTFITIVLVKTDEVSRSIHHMCQPHPTVLISTWICSIITLTMGKSVAMWHVYLFFSYDTTSTTLLSMVKSQ